MSLNVGCFAVLLAADDLPADLFGFPGVLKLLALVLGVLGPVAATAWGLGRRSMRARVRVADQQARLWESQFEKEHEQREKYRRAANEAQTAMKPLQDKLAEATAKSHAAEKKLQYREGQLQTAAHQFIALKKEREKLRGEAAQLQHQVLELSEKYGVSEKELTARTKALAGLERRMRSALKLEGQLWNAKALQARPKFRELSWRRRAIISVLNLKGGVGKTTVTAHLGAAFARRGYRVLLVDLDLQGSLTSLLLPQDKINQLFADRRLLQHFLSAAADDKTAKLADFAQEVFATTDGGGSLHVVGTTDNLAYAELSLTMRWLMGTGERDTRFLLRKALHLMSVTRDFDLVLIDCPPLVNISAVNALAASDYLLVPTTLSRKSAERVPKMLKDVLRHERFVRYINSKLQVLGLIANRTYPSGMTGAERDDWNHLGTWCHQAYGQGVTRFATVIPEIKEVRQSETEFLPQGTKGRLDGVFTQLAAEVEKELPHECRRTAKAPA